MPGGDDPHGPAMTPEEFRRHAHALVERMADYMAGVERYPVRARVAPGEVAANLPADPPQAGEPMEAILADVEQVILPGLTHWQHPAFFAYFPANSSPPSVLAEMLTATFGVNAMLWQTSPAATELEGRMMQWLAAMIGLPAEFTGVIYDTASTATLAALLAARERATGWRANEEGLAALGADGVRLAVYASEEAHSSVEKMMKVAGLGRGMLRKVAADEAFAMRPDALQAAIERDRAQGMTPACVVASLGGTGTGAMDPLRPVGDICRRLDVWLHVDAAWAGSALILPEHRHLADGIEQADSFVFNPHKWLMTNFDCTAFYVRDRAALERTLSLVPEYLKSPDGEAVTDYQTLSVQLGRRFRALKLWFVIRSYGVDRLRAILRDHIAWAGRLCGMVAAEPGFEIMSPQRLALFSFRYRPDGLDDERELDALNRRLLERLNDSGRLYVTQNRVRGRFAIRFQVGQTSTEWRHVAAAWETIRQTARELG